jgi:hypothetical protein
MKSIIDKFIASIQIDRNFNFNTAEYDYSLKFRGDGFGDFEESSLTTTKDCITDYIKESEAQVDLAKKVLNILEKNDLCRTFKYNKETGEVYD